MQSAPKLPKSYIARVAFTPEALTFAQAVGTMRSKSSLRDAGNALELQIYDTFLHSSVYVIALRLWKG